MEKTMFKFVTLYRRVDDEIALENFFSHKNLPLAENLPGLKRSEVSRVLGKPGGESRYHLMYELYFEEAEVFYEALGSDAGQELMRALKPWAEARLVTWFYCDSFEESTQDRIKELDATE